MRHRSTALSHDPERLARRRAGAKMGWYIHAAVYLLVNVGLVALSMGQGRSWAAYPLLGWAVAALMTGIAVLQRALPDSTRYDPAARRVHLAGTAVPLALMMGIFFTKYVVAVQIVMHPPLTGDRVFALCVGALYGAFSGMFAARGLRLWRLARRDGRDASGASLA